MDGDEVVEWMDLAERLAAVAPEKLRQVVASLREVVAAQEAIARFEFRIARRNMSEQRHCA